MAVHRPSGQKRKSVASLLVLLAVQLLLMSFSTRGDERVSTVESLTLRITAPFVAIGRWVGGGVSGIREEAGALWNAHERARELERDMRDMQRDLQRYREASAENRRLRRMLDMRVSLVPESVVAEVVSARLTPEERILVIDVGRADGVRRNLPVVTWGGAVGKTLLVGEHHTKVRLLGDPSSGVGGMVQRTRAQGTVAGSSDGRLLEMLYVPRLADVLHGDRVVTSGLDGIFPRGFGLGRVTSIRRSPDAGTQTIRLEPELDFTSIEEVLVLLESRGTTLLEGPVPDEWTDPEDPAPAPPGAAPEGQPTPGRPTAAGRPATAAAPAGEGGP